MVFSLISSCKSPSGEDDLMVWYRIETVEIFIPWKADGRHQ